MPPIAQTMGGRNWQANTQLLRRASISRLLFKDRLSGVEDICGKLWATSKTFVRKSNEETDNGDKAIHLSEHTNK